MTIEEKIDFQTFQPSWDDGELFSQDTHFFFKKASSGSVTALPDETSEVAQLIDGKATVRDLIESQYRQSQKVEIRKILSSIKQLAELGVLKNSNQVSQAFKDPKAGRMATESPMPSFWSEQLMAPGFSQPSPTLFWLLTLAATSLAVLGVASSWPSDVPNNWLKIGDSYLSGVILLWLAHSATLSVQAILQKLAVKFATGISPGLNLQLTPLHASVAVEQKYLLESMGRSKDIMMFFFSVLSPVFIFCVMTWVLPVSALQEHLTVLVPLYLLFYLDPYRRSPATQLIQKLVAGRSSEDILPFLKKRALISISNKEQFGEESKLLAFSTFAILWSFAAYDFVFDLTAKNIPNLIVAIGHERLTNKIGAGILLVLLSAMAIYIVIEIISTLFLNLIQPALTPLYRIRQKVQSKVSNDFSPEAVLGILKKSSLFKGLNDEEASLLSGKVKVKSYKKNTRVMIQGEAGKEIYILIEGQVRIERRTETGRTQTIAVLNSGAIIGEAALTDRKIRTADVVTVGSSVVAAIDCDDIASILSEPSMAFVMQSIYVSQFISRSDLFNNLPQEAATLLANEGEVQQIDKDIYIIHEGEASKDFFLLLRGQADVLKHEQKIFHLVEGNFFGEIAMVADVPRTASVKTTQDSMVLKISADTFWTVLTSNIGLASYIEAIADMRLASQDIDPSPPPSGQIAGGELIC